MNKSFTTNYTNKNNDTNKKKNYIRHSCYSHHSCYSWSLFKGKVSKIKTLSILLVALSICFAFNGQQPEISQPNIRGKAIMASVAVPGLGQHMLKNNLKSEIMLWTDATIWILYGGLNWYGTSRNHDAKLFSGVNAFANTKIKSDNYFRALERYDNSDAYNEDIRREARERFPDDPEAQINYFSQNGYFGDSTWNWKSDSLRFTYWEKRKTARAAFTRAGFVLGSAILNRLVSAIDCAFFTRDKRIGFVPNFDPPGIGLIYRF